MKKTLVAVAAMAAVTGAMAQATISGMIDGAYVGLKATNASGATTSTSSLASGGTGQSQITFAASEDLGGGMKAFANMRFNPDIFGTTATTATTITGSVGRDVSEVGISGSFGTVQLAKDYGIDFMVHAAADASGWTSGAKGVVHNAATGVGNAVIYVLPTFVPGVGVVVAKGVNGNANGAGDGTAYKLTYSTGPLNLQYAASTTRNVIGGTWATNFTTGGVTATTEAITTGSTSSVTALAGTYDLGMAKLYYGSFSAKSGGDGDQKSSSNMMGVSIPFGATTVGFNSTSAKRALADGTTTVKASGYRGKVSYALSKRTTAYGAYGVEKVDAGTAADKQTTIGLTHSF